MATVSCMLVLHGPRLDAFDCVCGRRLGSCGITAFDGLATPRRRQSRHALAVQSVLSSSEADRATRRTRTAARSRKATTAARRTPHVRKDRSLDAAAVPARRRRRQTPTTEHDAAEQRDDSPAGATAPSLYEDCCGRVYSRSVYRIEVLDELMLDGLRVADLRGPATFATVSSAVSSSVTIADVVAAAGAAANAANALDRARDAAIGSDRQASFSCSMPADGP